MWFVSKELSGIFLSSKASTRPSILRVTAVSLPEFKAQLAWNWLHLHLLPQWKMCGAMSPFSGTPSCAQGQLTCILSVWRRCRQLSNWASKLRFIDECWKGVDTERSFLTYTHYLEGLRNIMINLSGRLVSNSRLEPGSLGVSARHHVRMYSCGGSTGTAHIPYCTPQHPPVPSQGLSVSFIRLYFKGRSNLTPVVTGSEFDHVI
jgi:hypothetical protein